MLNIFKGEICLKQLKAAIKNNLPQILKVTFIGIIALCLLLLIVSLFVPGYQKTLKTQIKQANSTIGGIVDGITVKQSFTAEKEKLCGIRMRFGTYQRENSGGIIYIRVFREGESEAFANFQLETKHLSDNLCVDFDFPAQENSKGKEYLVQITSSGCNGQNCITLFSGQTKESSFLLVNGREKQEQVSILDTYYQERKYPYIWGFLLIAFFFFTLLGVLPTTAVDKKRKAGK